MTQARSRGPKSEPPRFGPPKTDRGRRAVPFDPQTVRALKKRRRRQLNERLALGEAYRDQGLIFCRQDDTPLDPHVVSHTFARLVRQMGLPVIRFHDLWHTFATLSLKAGIPTGGRQSHPRAQEPGHYTGLLPACCPLARRARDHAIRRTRGRSAAG